MNNDIYALLEKIAEQLTTVKGATHGLSSDFLDFKDQIHGFNVNQSKLLEEMQHTHLSIERFEERLKEISLQSSDSNKTANQAIHTVDSLAKEFDRLKEELVGRVNSIEGLFGTFKQDVEVFLSRAMTDEEFKEWELKNKLQQASLQIEEEREKREHIEEQLEIKKAAYKAAIDWVREFFKGIPPSAYVVLLTTISTVLFPTIKKMAIAIFQLLTGG